MREKAAEILGEIGPPAKPAIPLLRQRLNDQEPKVAVRSATSLRKIDGHGEGAVPVLVNLLTNPLPDLRGMAAWALAEFGAAASPALLGLIRCLDDADFRVRMISARSIGLVGRAARAAGRADPFGTNTAIAISKLEKLAEGEAIAANWGIDALSAMGPDAAPILAEIYRAADDQRGLAAARALMKLGPDAGEAIPTLMADLRGTNATRAVLSAQILGQLGEKGRVALPRLEELLQHQDARVRVRAAGAIWKLDGRTNDVLPDPAGDIKSQFLKPKRSAKLRRRSPWRHGSSGSRGRAVVAGDAQ